MLENLKEKDITDMPLKIVPYQLECIWYKLKETINSKEQLERLDILGR
jgi:hypothetical protein